MVSQEFRPGISEFNAKRKINMSDCREVLIYDTDHYKISIETSLAYLHLIDRQHASEMQRRGTASIPIPVDGVMLDISMEYGEMERVRNTLTQLTQYSYNQQSSVEYYRSSLSSNSLQAYIMCLQQNKLNQSGVHLFVNHATDFAFTLGVKWVNPPGMSGDVTLPHQPSFSGVISPPVIDAVWMSNQTRYYHIQKDPGQDIRISISLGNYADTLFMPKKPNISLPKFARVADNACPGPGCIVANSPAWQPIIGNADGIYRARVVGRWYWHHPHNIGEANFSVLLKKTYANGQESSPFPNDALPKYILPGESLWVLVSDIDYSDNDTDWNDPLRFELEKLQ